MPVAQDVVLPMVVHALFTVNGVAPHGLSFAGAGGAGEHVTVSVPQFSGGLDTHGLPATFEKTRTK